MSGMGGGYICMLRYTTFEIFQVAHRIGKKKRNGNILLVFCHYGTFMGRYFVPKHVLLTEMK